MTDAGGHAESLLWALWRGDAERVRALLAAQTSIDTPLAGASQPGVNVRSYVPRFTRAYGRYVPSAIETIAETRDTDRVASELRVTLADGRRRVALPVAVVAQGPRERPAAVRIYHARRDLDTVPARRSPLFATAADATPDDPHLLPDVNAEYLLAIKHGDLDRLMDVFAPGFSITHATGRVTERADVRAIYQAMIERGAPPLIFNMVTDDGRRLALEYTSLRSPAAGGLGIYERDGAGRLVALRTYDEFDPGVLIGSAQQPGTECRPGARSTSQVADDGR